MKDQHMFLTTKIPSPSGIQTHRVGVIAVRKLDDGITEGGVFKIGGTIVSKSEPFIAKKGVAKAFGRLDAELFNPKAHSYHFSKKDFDQFGGLKFMCREAGLKSDNNWFKKIDWEEADRKFKETFFTRIQK